MSFGYLSLGHFQKFAATVFLSFKRSTHDYRISSLPMYVFIEFTFLSIWSYSSKQIQTKILKFKSKAMPFIADLYILVFLS